MEEQIPYTKYALLTFGQYFDLNYKISMLQGYDLSLPTERYAPMNPIACKYNIQSDDSYEARLVMPIVAEIQIKYPTLLENIELVDTFTPVESSIQEIVVDITSQDTLNWTLIQFSVAGSPENQLSLIMSEQTLQLLTPEILQVVESLGLNIKI